jgi:hypothetical protein
MASSNEGSCTLLQGGLETHEMLALLLQLLKLGKLLRQNIIASVLARMTVIIDESVIVIVLLLIMMSSITLWFGHGAKLLKLVLKSWLQKSAEYDQV